MEGMTHAWLRKSQILIVKSPIKRNINVIKDWKTHPCLVMNWQRVSSEGEMR